MTSIEKIREEIGMLEAEVGNVEENQRLTTEELYRLNLRSQDLLAKRDAIQKRIYDRNLFLIQIREIYRLATIQFSRLRQKSTQPELTEQDVQELEKWIGRVKSVDSLKDIIDALSELSKYSPSNVKNIYALVQKIIIGGAYHRK